MKSLDGIEELKTITYFWIAKNQIQYLERYFDKLKVLSDLNLSGNKICSFKEVLCLNNVQSLRNLNFYDPNFGFIIKIR